MISKVREYVDQYEEYSKDKKTITELTLNIEQLAIQIENLTNKIDRNNKEGERLHNKVEEYQNAYNDELADCLEKNVQKIKEQKEQEIKEEMKSAVIALKSQPEVSQNEERIFRWMKKEKGMDLIQSNNCDDGIDMDVGSTKTLHILYIVKEIYLHIFCFKYLKYIQYEKIFYGILEVVILIPQLIIMVIKGIVKWLYEISGVFGTSKGIQFLRGLSVGGGVIFALYYIGSKLIWLVALINNFIFSMISNMVTINFEKVLFATVGVLLGIVLLYCVIIRCGNVLTRRYLKKYAMIWFAILVDSTSLEERLWKEKWEVFMSGDWKNWEEQIQSIRTGEEVSNPAKELHMLEEKKRLDKYLNNLSSQLKDSKWNTEKWEKELQDKQSTKEEKDKEKKEIEEKVGEKKINIVELESKLSQFPRFPKEYNNGVLTPYIPLRFERADEYNLRKLIYLEHNYQPMVIQYNDMGFNTIGNLVAIIGQLRDGFLKENYYHILNMTLVDMKTKGIDFPNKMVGSKLKMVTRKEELNSLYEELLESARKIIFSGLEENISEDNPIKLEKQENLFEYHIVFFLGVSLENMGDEMENLFERGAKVGFLPILFVSEGEYENLLKKESIKRVLSLAKEQKRLYKLGNIT
ncbi:MAG: hypothetical protein R3Y54_01975 [Eubacteriales bacterium]